MSRTRNRRRRVIPLDPIGPPEARQTAGQGRAAVMRGTWRDPDDTRPTGAARARQISGWRTYCPLRRMALGRGSQITERMILAADRLRGAVDLAVIGHGGARDMIAAYTGFGPSGGPSAGAIAGALASAGVLRVLSRLSAPQRIMLTAIVLLNRSLYSWTAERAAALGRPVSADVEMGRLLAILEILEDHYASEVDGDVAEGRAA